METNKQTKTMKTHDVCVEKFKATKEFVGAGFNSVHEEIKETKDAMEKHMNREERFYTFLITILLGLLSGLFYYIADHEQRDSNNFISINQELHELKGKVDNTHDDLSKLNKYIRGDY